MTGEMVIIGEVTSSHGYLGEVKVRPLTSFPERYCNMKSVTVTQQGKNRSLQIESVRAHRDWFIVKFLEVNSLEEAKAMREALLQVPEEEAWPLPAGQYYVFQLIGSRVYTTGGDYLGILEDVLSPGGNDVYQVVNPVSGKEILIPALKKVVVAIHLEDKRIEVELPPGLCESI